MSIFFQSYRSSSSGNCLALWTRTSSLLVDCGLKTQRDCREVLEAHRQHAGALDAVVVTHAHGDHIGYPALRVLGRDGVGIHAQARVLRQIRERHGMDDWTERPALHAFRGDALDIGDFHLSAIEVPHAPEVPNFAFRIAVRSRRGMRKIIVCTDLHDYRAMLPHLVDADFVFVEANHDLELLRQHPNFASRYHLNNVKTASLLQHAVRRSSRPPQAVMLGHLSEERNRRRLAIAEVQRMFARDQRAVPFHLDAAPAHKPSAIVEI